MFRYRKLNIILKDESPPADHEANLAAMTGGDRTQWANLRNEHFRRGVNKNSLHAIETAAFVVSLDDYPYEYDEVMNMILISLYIHYKYLILDLG